MVKRYTNRHCTLLIHPSPLKNDHFPGEPGWAGSQRYLCRKRTFHSQWYRFLLRARCPSCHPTTSKNWRKH